MQLTGREKKMVTWGGAALVVFVLVQFVIYPLVDQRARLQKRLVSKEKALAEMQLLKAQFQRLNQQSGSMADVLSQRAEGFSLFAFLEQNADEIAVKEHIAYMKPSESQDGDKLSQSRVEMKLQGVRLEQLLRFVEKSESPENLVGVAKMAVQENAREEGTLDATLVMVSVERPVDADKR
ncbi:MAG: type II secretion system protein GspM [Desulfobulbus sp.]|nr:type II secretion system protein GspM [Desulfobulbus sp.]